MKKQIRFYAIWGIILLIYLFVFTQMNIWMRASIYRSQHLLLLLLLQFIFMLGFGCLLFWLTYAGKNIQYTKYLAKIELLIIGGLGLYLSTALILSTLFMNLLNGKILWPFKVWINSDVAPLVGGIILGYEVCFFVYRMTSLKRD